MGVDKILLEGDVFSNKMNSADLTLLRLELSKFVKVT
jgi:hypothetical protein